jgi:signal transduction histidine kinase
MADAGARRPKPSSRLRLGLRSKLIAASLLLICFPALFIWSVGIYERLERQHITKKVGRSAEQLRRGLLRREKTPTGPDQRWLRRFAAEHHLMVRIVDAQGRVQLRTAARHAERWSDFRGWFRDAGDFFFGPAGPPDLMAYEATLAPAGQRPEVRAALAGRQQGLWRHAQDARIFVYYEARPLSGGKALYVTSFTRRNVRALYDLRYQLLKLTLILALVAAALGLWLGWRFVNPLVQLQQRIGGYIRGRDARPGSLALARRDELGDLSRDFAALVQRLVEQRRQAAELAGDLAHDLKGPIATVGASAELLESSTGEPDPERRARLVRSLSAAAGHMNRSVEGLLALARLEASLADARRVEVDLAALARRVVQGYRDDPRAASVELALEIERGSGAGATGLPPLIGVEPELEQLLRNLIDNALAHCEGKILVRLEPAADGARLLVCDDGPGVSAGNRDKIFRRFFSARSDNRGSGLGLTIAAAIARAHGGVVTLREEGELLLREEGELLLKGACFEVFFSDPDRES